jgi:hypothetical protein
MSHEPECTNQDDWVVEDCWVCQPLRAAYRRGREDAATFIRSRFGGDASIADAILNDKVWGWFKNGDGEQE